MRFRQVQRAEEAYNGALDLYKEIKKVEEILLSILLQMLRWSSKKDSNKVKEYADKAISVYKKPFNESVFRLTNINLEVMEMWFCDIQDYFVGPSGVSFVWHMHKDTYEFIKGRIEEEFLYAKKAQLDNVMKSRAELEREMSPTWSFPEWYLERLNKS